MCVHTSLIGQKRTWYRQNSSALLTGQKDSRGREFNSCIRFRQNLIVQRSLQCNLVHIDWIWSVFICQNSIWAPRVDRNLCYNDIFRQWSFWERSSNSRLFLFATIPFNQRLSEFIFRMLANGFEKKFDVKGATYFTRKGCVVSGVLKECQWATRHFRRVLREHHSRRGDGMMKPPWTVSRKLVEVVTSSTSITKKKVGK